MQRRILTLAAAALVLAACGTADSPTATNPSATGPNLVLTPPTTLPAIDQAAVDLPAVIAGNSEFALELFANLAATNGNVLIAPHSISEGLALPWIGAAGETAHEMRETMRYAAGQERFSASMSLLRSELSDRENPQLELAMANRAFGQEGFGFTDDYLADLSRWWGAGLEQVDFAGAPNDARMLINEWVAEQTKDRIEELLPASSVRPQTRLALVNAVYLNADWHFPFNPEGTQPRPFRLPDGTNVEVETMSFNEFLPSGSGKAWKAVQLPYAGEEMSMIVVAPANLERFRRNFDAEKLQAIRDSIKEKGIHLTLPKFELSYHTSLVAPLQELGMELAFGGGADFSGMTGTRGLFIDAIEHETFVKVDEEGTEAAGATGTLMALSHGPTIQINRPFVFWIQDDATGAILFLGQVTDPRS